MNETDLLTGINSVQDNSTVSPSTFVDSIQSGYSGFTSFKDFFNTWLKSTFGSGSFINPSNGQPNYLKEWQAVNSQMDSPIYDHEDNHVIHPENASIYDDIYNWIQEAVEAANDRADEQWLKTAKYNAEQSQIQREWDKYLDDTKVSRMMKQLKENGINPLLAMESIVNSSPTTGGSAASMSTYNSNSLYTGMMSSILGDKKIQTALLTILSTVLSSAVKTFASALF